jgi:hypothetical protein
MRHMLRQRLRYFSGQSGMTARRQTTGPLCRMASHSQPYRLTLGIGGGAGRHNQIAKRGCRSRYTP